MVEPKLNQTLIHTFDSSRYNERMRTIILATLITLTHCTPADLATTTPSPAPDAPAASARIADPTDPTPEITTWGVGSPTRGTPNVFAALPDNDFCIPKYIETNYGLTNGTTPYRNTIETIYVEKYRKNGYNAILVYFDQYKKNLTPYRLEMIDVITRYLALQNMTRDIDYELDIGTIMPYGMVGLKVNLINHNIQYSTTCQDTMTLN